MSLNNEQYINLGTFRKNGACVETPVWFVDAGDCFYVLSNNQAGKIKRLKNSDRCRIASCTVIGKITGQWQETTASLVTTAEEAVTAHNALKKKYGYKMLLLDTGARLSGKINQRSFIRIKKPLKA